MERELALAEKGNEKPVFWFVTKFGGLAILFYVLSLTSWVERLFWPLNLQANAYLAHWILKGLNQTTNVTGNIITSGNFLFVIKKGCDATEPIWLLIAAMIAFPARMRQKLFGITAGAALLFGINLFRIVGLFFLQRSWPEFYDTVHLTIFPALFFVLAMVLWFAWVKMVMAVA